MKKVLLRTVTNKRSDKSGVAPAVESKHLYICPPSKHFNEWSQDKPIRDHGFWVDPRFEDTIREMVENDTIPAWEELDEMHFQPMIKTVLEFATSALSAGWLMSGNDIVKHLDEIRDGRVETARVAAWKKHLSWLS